MTDMLLACYVPVYIGFAIVAVVHDTMRRIAANRIWMQAIVFALATFGMISYASGFDHLLAPLWPAMFVIVLLGSLSLGLLEFYTATPLPGLSATQNLAVNRVSVVAWLLFLYPCLLMNFRVAFGD